MLSTAKSKLVAVAAVVALTGLAAYWHFSPYLAMRSMRAAAEAKDADAFNERVDYPKLRESIKGQMAAVLTDGLGSKSASQNSMEAAGAALALALVNPLVDALVRPEMVMKTMSKGEFDLKPGKAPTSEPTQAPTWDVKRLGMNKVIAYAQDPNDPKTEKVGVVFERNGFADWKLTELRLPTRAAK